MEQMATTSDQKAIVCGIDEMEYLILVEHVMSIERVQHITRVPNLLSYVKGVINLRGVIIPIIDLKDRLQIGKSSFAKESRIVIISYQDIEIGFIVDQANDVIDIHTEQIEPRPETVGTVEAGFISGVVKLEKRLLLLLDLEAVLENKTIQVGM